MPFGERKSMSRSTKRCPHCNASLKMYWHTLKPGLVRPLVKMLKAVNQKRNIYNRANRTNDTPLKKVNDIRVGRLPGNLKFTTNERCNFSKLRVHGLIARVKIDGKVKSGRWLITRKGYQFLKGEKVPCKVLTFRNKVEGHSDKSVTIAGVMKDQADFETINTIQFRIFEQADKKGQLNAS